MACTTAPGDARGPVGPQWARPVMVVYAILLAGPAVALLTATRVDELTPTIILIRTYGVVGPILAFGIWMIRVWRQKSYRRWPAVLRWAYLAAAIGLAMLGGVAWVGSRAQSMGWWEALWPFAIPFAYGLVQGLWRAR